MENELPAPTRDFIARHIASVEELEILLLLHEHKDREWTAAEINVVLRSQEASIAKWLAALAMLGLAVTADARYRFAPKTEELAREVSALAEAYCMRRIKVIEFIFSRPNESLLSFVRAFDFRGPS